LISDDTCVDIVGCIWYLMIHV